MAEDCFYKHESRRAKRLEIIFLAVSAILLMLIRDVDSIRMAYLSFSGIVLEAFPFMLLGSIAGGVIEEYLPTGAVKAMRKGRTKSVLIAALIGLVIPVCECAIVTVVRRLLRKGVPQSAAIAYMLAGPLVNPVVALSTAVAYRFQWHVVIIRLVAGYVVAVFVALLAGKFLDGKFVLSSATESGCSQSDSSSKQGRRWSRVIRHSAEDFVHAGKYLVMGAFLAGLLQSIVSRSIFTNITSSPVSSILVMMFLAVVLSICADGDAFVAASFGKAAFPFASQMAFMLLGPMLDLKLLLMYKIVFRPRTIIVLATTVIISVFCISCFIHFAGWGL